MGHPVMDGFEGQFSDERHMTLASLKKNTELYYQKLISMKSILLFFALGKKKES